jgi:hypothetical protein
MADIHCPMCGKSNPDHLEVCQFCDARLTPLISPKSSDDISHQKEENADLPEWLNLAWDANLDPEKSPSSEDEADAQEWLDRIRVNSEEDNEAQPDTYADSEGATPSAEGTEWLNRIRSLHQSDQETQVGDFEEKTNAIPQSGSSQTQDEGLDLDGNDLPGWLDRLNDGQILSEDRTTDENGESHNGGLPDWLDGGLGSEEDAPPAEGEDAPPAEGEVAFDFPSPLIDDEPDSGESKPDVDIPDWLSSLGMTSDSDEILVPEKPDSAPSSDTISRIGDDEIPDWLSNMGTDRDPDPFLTSDEPGAEAIPAEEDEEIPEWLSTLGIESSDEAISSPEISQAEDSDIPDWLSDIGIDSKGAEATASPSTEGDDIPARISEMGIAHDSAEEAEDTEGAAEPISQVPEGDMPDWLSSFGGGDSIPGEKLAPEIAGSGSEQLEDLGDWFSDLEGVESLAGEPTPAAEALETDEEMPGWLKNLGSVVTGTVDDDSIPAADDHAALPFVQDEAVDDDLLDVEGLPEWLTPDSAVAESVEGGSDSDLTPAELPGWLAAMRPIDGDEAGGALEDGTIESAGPLAGLRNILPAEPEIVQFKKPPVYSAKLWVSYNQQAQADIFQELLASEGKATTIPDIPLVSSQRVLRWLIAFILMAAMGLMVIGGSQNVPLPSSAAIPDSAYAASRIVSAIPDQAPVLLAFDYEPGTSGEMQAAAAALVDHLMLKGARLTLVSTLPTGPAVGEYFIQNIQTQHNYTSGDQYVNLGYIPGGAAGLASFVQIPKWVFKQSYDGMEPWNTQPLQDIETISDFSVVVIITDDPDVARTWVEQVQPKLGGTPLLMVISAQAEPLVRPYFSDNQNAQVQGIINGLTGGAAYEVTVGKTNLGRTYWDAFSIGLIIAIAMVLIGGGANVILHLLTQSKRKDQGVAR